MGRMTEREKEGREEGTGGEVGRGAEREGEKNIITSLIASSYGPA